MLNNLGDLAKIPPFDLGYSFITLQHNTPPVIAAIVARLLTLLKPGGCAFLHIPLALPDYKFTVADYLSDEKSGKNMEIHVLPRNDLNDIADACGCDIVTSENIGGVDIAYSENLVFRKRVGTS